MIDLKEVLQHRWPELNAYTDRLLDSSWVLCDNRRLSDPDPNTGQVQEIYDSVPFRGKVLIPKTIEKTHVAGAESYVQYAQLVYRDVTLQPGDLLLWGSHKWVVMGLLPHQWQVIPRCRIRLIQEE